MSAFDVHDDHINALVNAAHQARLVWYHDEIRYEIAPDTTTAQEYSDQFAGHVRTLACAEICRMLRHENAMSVAARYNEDPIGDEITFRYAFRAPVRDGIAILKAIDCYEYQSCEHVAWPTTCAYAFCQSLRRAVIRSLPGYDDAPWEISPQYV